MKLGDTAKTNRDKTRVHTDRTPTGESPELDGVWFHYHELIVWLCRGENASVGCVFNDSVTTLQRRTPPPMAHITLAPHPGGLWNDICGTLKQIIFGSVNKTRFPWARGTAAWLGVRRAVW